MDKALLQQHALPLLATYKYSEPYMLRALRMDEHLPFPGGVSPALSRVQISRVKSSELQAACIWRQRTCLSNSLHVQIIILVPNFQTHAAVMASLTTRVSLKRLC